MKHTNLCTAAVVLLAFAAYAVGASAASSSSDREALEQTGTAIRCFRGWRPRDRHEVSSSRHQ